MRNGQRHNISHLKPIHTFFVVHSFVHSWNKWDTDHAFNKYFTITINYSMENQPGEKLFQIQFIFYNTTNCLTILNLYVWIKKLNDMF